MPSRRRGGDAASAGRARTYPREGPPQARGRRCGKRETRRSRARAPRRGSSPAHRSRVNDAAKESSSPFVLWVMAENNDIDPFGDDDLDVTAGRLRAARVEPTPIELDRALTTARRRAGRGRARSTTGGFMRSKVAIVSILAIGVLMSGTGATLAFQGSSGQVNAAQEEYIAPNTTVAPGPGEGTGTEGTTDSQPGGKQTQTLGEESSGGDGSSPAAAQETRQEAATAGDDGKLPFTGLAAMPIIAIGLALLAAGGLLQRRNSRSLS